MSGQLSKKLFKEKITHLCLCFPKSSPVFSEEMLKAWYSELCDTSDNDFTKNVVGVINKETFFPSVSKLKAHSERRLVC